MVGRASRRPHHTRPLRRTTPTRRNDSQSPREDRAGDGQRCKLCKSYPIPGSFTYTAFGLGFRCVDASSQPFPP